MTRECSGALQRLCLIDLSDKSTVPEHWLGSWHPNFQSKATAFGKSLLLFEGAANAGRLSSGICKMQ